MPFLSSLNTLLQDAYVIFHEGVDYFEIEHKTYANKFWVGGAVPP